MESNALRDDLNTILAHTQALADDVRALRQAGETHHSQTQGALTGLQQDLQALARRQTGSAEERVVSVLCGALAGAVAAVLLVWVMYS
jgi:hypothetical protein